MENKSYSRYRNIKSPIHSLDPNVKFIGFLLLIIATFLSQSVLTLSTVVIFTLFVSLLARVKVRSYINIFLMLIPFFITMFLLYWLVLLDPELAAEAVGYMSLRFYLFVLISVIFTSSTKEMDIAGAIEWFIYPLRLIKVPTYEISMMIMLAIRFIPLMFEDLGKIMVAQTSRGVNTYNGTFKTKVKGIFNSLLPMFVLSFKRAEDVSNAMIIRGYEIGKKRTKYRKNKFRLLEFFSLLLMIGLIVLIIMMGGH